MKQYKAWELLPEEKVYFKSEVDADKFRLGKVLTEPLTGYKKTKEGVVITAEIPA